MLRRTCCGLFAILLLVAGAGCMEEAVLVTVKKDGSGTIEIRDYLSPQLTEMMEGMGGMMAGMAEGLAVEGGEPAAAAKTDLAAMMEDGAKQKAGSMGEGVTLKSFTPGTNKAGWKGYTATYAFTDINQVKLSLGNDADGPSAAPGGTSGSSGFTFGFQPGDPAVLKILPVSDGADVGAEGGDGGAASDDLGMEGAGMMGMEQMMASMLAGMRLTLLVRVEGEIKETNASHRSEKHKDVITVMDLQMDEVIKNPEAFKLLAGGDARAEAKLRQMNLPGVKLPEKAKAIEVKF